MSARAMATRAVSSRARSTCGALVVWLALATPTSVDADATSSAPLEALDATRDLEIELDLVLADATTRARRWHRAWAITFALGLAAQGVLVGVASSRDERIANLLGLIPPITGLSIQLATLLAALGGPEPNEPPEVTLERYARSEREKRNAVLEPTARSSDPPQRECRRQATEPSNWFAHVGPIFLLAVAALQLFVTDRPVTAGLQVGIGITISQTWTSPRVATRASP